MDYIYLFNFTSLLFFIIAALISQKAGMLALFLEGCGVLGALFNLMFYELTGSMVFSLVIASLILGVMSGTVAWVTLKSKGNCMFSGLALNLVFTGLAGFLAKLFYGSHEIIYYYCDSELSVIIMILSLVLGMTLVGVIEYFFNETLHGIAFKLCGKDSEFLINEGYNVFGMKVFSWFASGFFASLAGILLSIQVDAYIPGLTSGRGWIALIIIFLGLEDMVLSTLWAIIIFGLQLVLALFDISVYDENTGFSSLMISLPYVFCFVAFVIISVFRKLKNRNVKNKII